MTMTPDTQLTVTLSANEWNGVFAAMGKAQYEMVAPLIDRIRRQMTEQEPEAFGPLAQPAMNGTGQPLQQ